MSEAEINHNINKCKNKLSRPLKYSIKVATMLFFAWLFWSGWINLWNKRHTWNPPQVWGGHTLSSVTKGGIVGYFFSYFLIWELELILMRRNKQRTLKENADSKE